METESYFTSAMPDEAQDCVHFYISALNCKHSGPASSVIISQLLKLYVKRATKFLPRLWEVLFRYNFLDNAEQEQLHGNTTQKPKYVAHKLQHVVLQKYPV